MIEFEYRNPKFITEKLEDAERYFRFGGYDILVWEWVIKLDSNSDTDTPVIVLYEKATKIANSFSEFLQKYRVNDPESLLGYE